MQELLPTYPHRGCRKLILSEFALSILLLIPISSLTLPLHPTSWELMALALYKPPPPSGQTLDPAVCLQLATGATLNLTNSRYIIAAGLTIALYDVFLLFSDEVGPSS